VRASTSLRLPSIAELRAVTQPESVLGRVVAEHWAGRLYMRRLSPYLTRVLVRTRLTANAVTALMIPTGLAAGLALSFPGVWSALGAVLLVQLQLLLDCCDGEVARWRRTYSPAGIYLDRIGHAVTSAVLAAGLGVRADRGWGSIEGWTAVGLLAALLVLLVRSESDLVYVARAHAGVPALAEGGEPLATRPATLRRLRRVVGFAPFFWTFSAIELSLLALAAAIGDALAGTVTGSRVLLLLLVSTATLSATGRLLWLVSSERLK
jgi:phosphatidylglycerophosphate synthase